MVGKKAFGRMNCLNYVGLNEILKTAMHGLMF